MADKLKRLNIIGESLCEKLIGFYENRATEAEVLKSVQTEALAVALVEKGVTSVELIPAMLDDKEIQKVLNRADYLAGRITALFRLKQKLTELNRRMLSVDADERTQIVYEAGLIAAKLLEEATWLDSLFNVRDGLSDLMAAAAALVNGLLEDIGAPAPKRS